MLKLNQSEKNMLVELIDEYTHEIFMRESEFGPDENDPDDKHMKAMDKLRDKIIKA